jgi:hypothetical protein
MMGVTNVLPAPVMVIVPDCEPALPDLELHPAVHATIATASTAPAICIHLVIISPSKLFIRDDAKKSVLTTC